MYLGMHSIPACARWDDKITDEVKATSHVLAIVLRLIILRTDTGSSYHTYLQVLHQINNCKLPYCVLTV